MKERKNVRFLSRALALLLVMAMAVTMPAMSNVRVLAASKKAVQKVTLKIDKKTVNSKTVDIEVGKTKTIKVTVSPTSAKKSIAYSSAKTKFATVSKKGKITAKKVGKSKITVTVTGKNGKKKKATFTVNVTKKKVTKVTLKAKKTSIKAGASTTITATLSPSGAESALKWTTSNKNVLKITKTGKTATVQGVAKGKATITCTTDNKKKASVKITVTAVAAEKEVTGITITKDEDEDYISVGNSVTLNAALSPSGAKSTVTWSSSDKSIIAVTKKGEYTATAVANAEGEATITCTAANGVSKSITLRAQETPIEKITLNKGENVKLTIGQTSDLKYEITPADATNQAVTWKSSKPGIVSVDTKGTITAKAVGNATITVYTDETDENGNPYSDSIVVEVEDSSADVDDLIVVMTNSIDEWDNTVLVGETADIRVTASGGNTAYSGDVYATLEHVSGYDYYELTKSSATMGSNGQASFGVKLQSAYQSRYGSKAILDANYTENDYAYASYLLTISAGGNTKETRIPVSFAQVIPETLHSNYALAVENQHNSIIPSIDSGSSVYPTSVGGNALDTYPEEYVVDQQVSASGTDDHMVVLDAAPTLIHSPSSGGKTKGKYEWIPDAEEEEEDTEQDPDAEEDVVSAPIDRIEQYSVYAGENKSVTISGVPGGLKSLDLIFSSMRVSDYTRIVVRAYQAETNYPLVGPEGNPVEFYITSEDGAPSGGKYIHSVDCKDLFTVTEKMSEFDLKIFVESAGFVNSNRNDGFVLTGVEGYFKNDELRQYAAISLSKAVTWLYEDVDEIYTGETRLSDAQLYLGDRYNPNYTYTYAIPRTGKTGNAIICAYENDVIKEYYMYPTKSRRGQGTQTSKNILFKNEDGNPDSRFAFKITSSQAKMLTGDEYSVKTDKSGRLVINSEKVGYVPVSVQVRYRNDRLNYDMDTTVHWGPNPTYDVDEPIDFYTLAGQKVNVTATVLDRNGNKASNVQVKWALEDANSWSNVSVTGYGVVQNADGTALSDLDEGMSTITLRSAEAIDLKRLTCTTTRGSYTIKIEVKGQEVETGILNIHWIKAGIYFKENIGNGREYNTSLLTAPERLETGERNLTSTGEWIIGSKVVGTFNNPSENGAVVGISNLEIEETHSTSVSALSHVRQATTSDEVDASIYSTLVKVTGVGEGYVILTLKPVIPDDSKISVRTTESLYDGEEEQQYDVINKYDNAGTGEVTSSNSIKVNIKWGTDSYQYLQLINPNENYDIQNTTDIAPYVYAKVVDSAGYPKAGTKVTYNANNETKSAETDENGIVKIRIDVPSEPGTASVSAYIGASEGSRKTTDIYFYKANNPIFETQSIGKNTSARQILIYFTRGLDRKIIDAVNYLGLANTMIQINDGNNQQDRVDVDEIYVDENNDNCLVIKTERDFTSVATVTIRQNVITSDGIQYNLLSSDGVYFMNSLPQQTIDVTNISVDADNVALVTGESKTVTATILPADATDPTLDWTVTAGSDKIEIQKLANNKITITGKMAGSATIKATATSVSNVSKTIHVTVTDPAPVNVPATGVSLQDEASLSVDSITMKVGDTRKLKAVVTPENATDKTVEWKVTEGSEAITLEPSGQEATIVGIAPGTAKLQVRALGASENSTVSGDAAASGNAAFTKTVTIIVKPLPVTAVTLDVPAEIEMTVGELREIMATTDPENGVSGLTWSITAGRTNASVTGQGGSAVVEALAAGEATLTVTAEDSDAKAVVKVKVVEPVKSNIIGSVFTAAEREPISGVTITLTRGDSFRKTAETDNSGNYSFTAVPVGSYVLTASKAGYIDQTMNVEIIEADTNYLESILLVRSGNGNGTASGRVINAYTGDSVGSVTLNFYRWWNNTEGTPVDSKKSNGDGEYSVSLPYGNYTMEAVKDGFITTTKNIVVQNTVTNNQNISISPSLPHDTYRIVLTWGEKPRDLDSHTVGTFANGEIYHVYYADKNSYDETGEEICSLDVDERFSYGPETTTLKVQNAKPYYFYVHNYAEHGNGRIPTSEAKVQVFRGDREVATYYVPADQNTDQYYWNVFAIVDGRIVTSNTFSDTPDVSYAGNLQ